MAGAARLQDQLAAAITHALEVANVTQAELARMTGLSTKHINKMVQGEVAAPAMFDYCAHALGQRFVVTLEPEE